MLVLGPLMLVALIGAGVLVVTAVARSSKQRHQESPAGSGTPAETPATGPIDRASREPELKGQITRWVGAGLLSDAQGDAIRAFERRPVATREPAAPPPARRIPVVAEALGYLGGVLTATGLALVVARSWPDWATAARLGVSGATALILVGAGALVRARSDPALARLRGFLWLAATAATGLFAGVLAADGLDVGDPAGVTAACAASITILSGMLWWRQPARPFQQLTFVAGVVVFAGASAGALDGSTAVGVTVWAVGVAGLWFALRRATTHPIITEAVAASAVVIGPLFTIEDSGTGTLFALAAASSLVVLAALPALTPRRGDVLVCGIVGGLMTVQSLPGTLAYFANGAGILTGLVTWAIGAVLLVVGTRRLVRAPMAAEVVGGLALVGGAALTGAQSPSFATIFGLATAVGLLVLGTLPGQVLCSAFGSVGLLVNVPWAIAWFFPGENRAPLLVTVSGALLIAVAVLLTRMGGRFRRELPHGHGASPA